MYPIYEFENEILSVLREFGIEEVKLLKPPAGKGDAAMPCFGSAKKMNRNPFELAEELESKANLKDLKLVKSCKAENGYLNFFVDENLLAEKTIYMIEDKGEEYGRGEKKKEKILLEHTSANPTGPLHIGRARNPIIGDTLARILRFYGYDVKTEYYIDDVGTQVAILAWGVKNLKNLRSEDQPDEKRDHVLVKCYQEADKLRESDENVDREIRELLKKYEQGDEQTVKFFEGVYNETLGGILESLKVINIEMDNFVKESAFIRDGSVERVLKKLEKYCNEKDGALYIDLRDYGIDDNLFLTRKDGTSLYVTRDIAYHLNKFERCDVSINILGEDHKLEVNMLKAALKLLGIEKKQEVIFYSFISLPEGKMSTRKQRVVYLDDLVDEAIERARQEVKKRRAELSEERIEKIARAVGTGAVRYNIIKVQPSKPIKFRWEEALNFEGNSAPFIQYAHARACSILRKAGFQTKNQTKNQTKTKIELTAKEETDLIKAMAEFPVIVEETTLQRAPHLITEYLMSLSSLFNLFYMSCPVIHAEKENREKRLRIVNSVAQIIENGCNLLGIKALEEM